MKLVRLIKICLKETYIKFCLKQGVALSPLLFNFTLEYVIRKVQEYRVGLKLNGTHQILAYADDVNLLLDNINKVSKAIPVTGRGGL
jgi:hypothetical protein